MLDVASFQLAIEDIVLTKKLSYMEAILLFCSDHELEPDDIRTVMSPNLRDKLYMSAQDDGYIQKTARLPL